MDLVVHVPENLVEEFRFPGVAEALESVPENFGTRQRIHVRLQTINPAMVVRKGTRRAYLKSLNQQDCGGYWECRKEKEPKAKHV